MPLPSVLLSVSQSVGFNHVATDRTLCFSNYCRIMNIFLLYNMLILRDPENVTFRGHQNWEHFCHFVLEATLNFGHLASKTLMSDLAFCLKR